MSLPAVKLVCVAQTYDWGKVGNESLVGQLYQKQTNEKIKNFDTTHFAEFWMGTHPNGPCLIHSTNKKLSDFLKEQTQDVLGEHVHKRFNGLPFLLKVLSVNQALSIQAHPDKELAQKLFKKFPKIYKDANHKPELCCALTKFEAFCGFLPAKKIYENISSVEELRNILGEEILKEFEKNQNIKPVFTKLMKADPELVKIQLEKLINRLSIKLEKTKVEQVILRLYEKYPGDVGCFAPYMLNLVLLNPGESLFLSPNEPHAYLSGDCVEIMANSDNTVRAGLTPKFRDVDTLCEMLTYDDNALQKMKSQGIKVNENQIIYKPPVDEFMLRRVLLKEDETTEWISKSGSIMIIIQGEGTIEMEWNKKNEMIKVNTSDVYFIPSETKLKAKGNLLLFVASCNDERILNQ